jgi:hypothetical protein
MSTLLTTLQSMDQPAWETLGSTGLVRRARKDLERGIPVALEGAPGESVQVRVETHLVTFPAAGPAKATCTCPARGICQHILAAGLWLGEQPPPEAAAAIVEETPAELPPLPDVTAEQLRKFAGAANWRVAWKLAETEGLAVVQSPSPAVVQFPENEVEVRFVPGLGLEGAILRGASSSQKTRYVAAALLALWKADGRAAILVEPGKPAPEEDLPTELPKILEAVQRLLEEGLTIGLTHLSGAFHSRLSTLSVSALAARAPRLARLLQAAADQLDDVIHRQARGDSRRLFSTLVQARALAAALQAALPDPPADLLGVMRATYESGTAALELYGLGAEVWRTPSGFQGLTCYFWDPLEGNLLTWSDTRPESQLAGFSPVRVYLDRVMWGCNTPARLCRSAVTLSRARVSSAGRLSSAESTQARLGTGTIPTAELLRPRYYADWEKLGELARRLAAPGLRQPHPMSAYVAVHPWGFGQRVFDSTEQTLHWALRDREGRELPLRVPYDEWTGHTIDALEKLRPRAGAEQNFVFFGRLIVEGGRAAFHPVSILRLARLGEAPAVYNLSLDPPRPDAEPAPGSDVLNLWETWKKEMAAKALQKATNAAKRNARRWFAHFQADPEAALDEVDDEFAGNPALLCLARVQETLAQVAEAGTRALGELHRAALLEQAEAAGQLGLTLLPPLLRAVAEGRETPRALARAGYVVQLHRQVSG